MIKASVLKTILFTLLCEDTGVGNIKQVREVR